MTAAVFGLIIISALALLVLWFEGMANTPKRICICAALIALAMLLRGLAFDYRTGDYNDFLSHWVEFYREKGGFEGLAFSIGNYNLPYTYFLALFSYIEVPDLYLIKLLSIFFDVVLAWGIARLVYLFTDRRSTIMAAFFVTLYLPTVYLNGALWGQCDSIYAAFAVWSIVFALSDRPVLSVVSVALSFAFKLQAVFIMPVFLIFLFARKMKWYHLAAFPITYAVTTLPAVLAGRPFMDAILLYFNQAETVGSALNYNSPSVFSLIPWGAEVNEKLLSEVGIVLAFLFLFLLFLHCWLRRESLGNRELLICSLLIAVAVPWFLPHMHDRYFFIADALSVALAFAIPPLCFVPALCSFASGICYYAYLKMRFLMPLSYGGISMLIVIISMLVALMTKNAKKFKKRC